MGRGILFWGLIVALKIYVYTNLIRLFKRPLYRGIAISLVVGAALSFVLGMYTMMNSFPPGVVQKTLFSNLSLALLVSFTVCEVLLVPFFLLDDLFVLGKKGYYYFRKVEKEAQPERRNFLKRTGALLGSLPFLSFIHGITKGKYNYTVHRQQVFFEDLPTAFDGFVVAQISDIHAGSFDDKAAVRKGIQMIQDQGADVIVFTGDLVNTYASEIKPYIEDFKRLSAPYGKFSVLGNHDYPMYKRMFDSDEHGQRNLEKVKGHHAKMEFDLLMNEHRTFEKDGEKIHLVGVENWGRSHHFPKRGDLDMATSMIEDKEFMILLSHDPTHWEDKVKDYDKHIHLTLSGHTHGMQMGVDLPMFKWSPIKYAYKHWAGLYKELGKYLYVNRGFGFLWFAGRVGIFPEITLLELKKK